MSNEHFEIEDSEIVELSEDQHQLAVKKIAEADEEIKQMRMQIRWGTKQVDLVKRAAELVGVPYQTYVKMILFRQALQDIEKAEAALKKAY